MEKPSHAVLSHFVRRTLAWTSGAREEFVSQPEAFGRGNLFVNAGRTTGANTVRHDQRIAVLSVIDDDAAPTTDAPHESRIG